MAVSLSSSAPSWSRCMTALSYLPRTRIPAQRTISMTTTTMSYTSHGSFRHDGYLHHHHHYYSTTTNNNNSNNTHHHHYHHHYHHHHYRSSSSFPLPSHHPNVRNILITSALPYVNNTPHLGNITGSLLSADVYARYCRMRGYPTLFVSGTDEYGTATEMRAADRGVSPQALVDEYHAVHRRLYEWFGIAADVFGRTTHPRHTVITHQIFRAAYHRGFLTQHPVSQLYCSPCQRALADRLVEGTCPRCGYEHARGDQCDGCGAVFSATDLEDPRCSRCGSTPEIQDSEHLFLDLPRLTEDLAALGEEREWYDGEDGITAAVTQAWLREGLTMRCITRDLQWGIPVPAEVVTEAPELEGKVLYVWFDAPIGYISMTAAAAADSASSHRCADDKDKDNDNDNDNNQPVEHETQRTPLSSSSSSSSTTPSSSYSNAADAWKEWWIPHDRHRIELVQFMGKDNIPFHSILSPASLIASGIPFTLPSRISATHYLSYEGRKFSKSRGVGVFAQDAMESGIPADAFRFYLMMNRPESTDTSFSWPDFIAKANKELLANLGNFVHRGLSFAGTRFDGEVPRTAKPEDLDAAETAVIDDARRAVERYERCMENLHLKDGLRTAMDLAHRGNLFLQERQPWVLIKEDPSRCAGVVYVTCNLIRMLASMVAPFIPDAADRLQGMLGVDSLRWPDTLLSLRPGHQLTKPAPLFSSIKDETVAIMRERCDGLGKESDNNNNNNNNNNNSNDKKEKTSSSEPYFPLDIRVGIIRQVSDVPDADRLFQLSVDIGEENLRTVVAGMKGHYTAENLVNRWVVAVCNLKPAKLKGIKSTAMLLAAESSTPEGTKTVALLQPANAEPLAKHKGNESVPIKPGMSVVPQEYKLPDQSFKKMSIQSFQKMEFNTGNGGVGMYGMKELQLAPTGFAVVPDQDKHIDDGSIIK